MKNLFKYIGLSAILIFSFYYTEKMSSVVINNSSLMTDINNKSIDYEIEAVSAIIEDEYIIPGSNGYAVNVLKSYDNMKFMDTFNSYYLVYDVVKPNISLYNNKDKIIKYGNKNKNGVSLVITNNHDIEEYAKEKNVKLTKLVDIYTFDKTSVFEQINNDYINYKKVDKALTINNINKDICIINSNIIDICKNEKKYLVEKNLILNNYNLSSIKDSIKSGYIIFINDNVSLADFKILLRQIYYQDLDVISLSNLIKEERD